MSDHDHSVALAFRRQAMPGPGRRNEKARLVRAGHARPAAHRTN